MNNRYSQSFAFFLAGFLALSGILFTHAYADADVSVETVGTSEVHIETTVVSEALTFIANNGASESEVVVDEEVTVETSQESEVHVTVSNMSYVNPNESCEENVPQTPLPVTLVITKIKCANESDLPNWGQGGPDITANTASTFLASHQTCSPVDHWGFEWGNQNVQNPGDDFVWDAGASRGWTSLGYTNAQGVLTAQVVVPLGTTEIRVREILEPGYLPFSYGATGNDSNNVSAELYCANDVIHYDNFDFVRTPVAGQTYHCVAWNVRNSAVNHPPVITLVGDTPVPVTVGGVFVDQGATATDEEDGPLTPVVTGSVNTSLVGTYTIRYTATDAGGLSVFVERTVNVIPAGPVPACADGIDNDTPADGLIDFPADLGCSSATDNDENNAPTIILVGANPDTVTIGSSFIDAGATATDTEDGVLTPVITGTVNTAVIGTYTKTYVATDSQGLAATTTRTINVIPADTLPACSDGIDNDTPADGAIDFPLDAGCVSAVDNDENNAPVITLVGTNPFSVIIGNAYTDAGATATDTEDGVLVPNATGTVDTATLGAYTIRYNVSDSKGLAATEVTRTVNVISAPVNPPPGGGNPGGSTPAKCANGQDDDADGKADYPQDPGCTDSLDNDETDTPTNTGGGGGTPGLQIFNEKLTVVTPSSVKITWNTNLLADSRVVYGDLSKNPAGSAPQYGYTNTTATATEATSSHSMIVTGLPENAVAFLRPVSSSGASTVVGIELVTPLVAGSCTYLEKYMRLGYDNDPVEVTKLQRFLKEYEGFTHLAVTGIFDITTDKAVRAFQNKYGSEILTPWALPADTGYVYYTTKKKVNEIYCKKAFPLDSNQLLEIAEYTSDLRDTVANAGESISDLPTARPTVTVTRGPVGGGSPVVVDLSKIDLSDMAPKAPLVKLIPQEQTGELASGITTDEANTVDAKKGTFFSDLLAALPMRFDTHQPDTSDSATNTKKTDTLSTSTKQSKATSTSLIAGAAAAIGVSSGTFAVWMILFAGIIVLGYIMARKNRGMV